MKNEIELLDSLSKYYFKFGIFSSEGLQTVDVNVLNTDNTKTTIPMKIADIMYFTEYGTITIPGQHVLNNTMTYISNLLQLEMSKIVDKILTTNITDSEIENRLKEIAIKIENYVKNYIINIIKKTNKLGSIINKDINSDRYIYNPVNLSKYVKCTLFKK